MNDISLEAVLEKLEVDLLTLISDLIVILIVFLLAYLFVQLLSRATSRVIAKAQKIDDENRSKSLVTSMTMVRSAGRYMIYFAAICVIIHFLGYGTVLTNLVTAAGVGALVISFGAQSVIGDMLAGLFLLFERQYGVGDFVKIGDYEGTVTSVAMRCTYLKTWTGQKIIIPNGQVKSVINYSGEFNMAMVDVPVPYEEDAEKMSGLIREVAGKYYEDNPDICYPEEPMVAAINAFDDSSVRISVYQKARKRNHYRIQRELRMAIKKRFDEEGISIPYTQIVVHEGKEEEK